MLNQRLLVVNADDMGISNEIDEGIIKAHSEGMVTSASVLVNFPGFKSTLSALTEYGELGIGLHLNLTWGKPVSDPQSIPSLVNRHGRFMADPKKLALLSLSGRLKQRDVEREIDAQFDKFLDSGLFLDHVDTHQHLLVLREIAEVVVKRCKKLNVPFIRIPIEPSWSPRFFMPKNLALWALWKSRKKTRKLTRSHNVLGVTLSGKIGVKTLDWIIRRLRPGITELICHPAIRPVPRALYPDNLGDKRVKEFQTLIKKENRARMEDGGIKIVSFRQINDNRPEDSS